MRATGGCHFFHLIPLHRLTFLRPQKPRDFRAHPRPQTPQALSLLPQKLCDLGHIFGHILLPFFLSILWAFAFLLVRLLLYLGVTDCVRPGVATFFMTKVLSKRSKSRPSRVSRTGTCCTEARRFWWQRGLGDAKFKTRYANLIQFL